METRKFICSFLLLTNLWATQTTKSICPAEFLHRCKCGPADDDQYKYITNCTHSRFNKDEMLQELPPETNVLILTGNDFPHLPPNLFGKLAPYEKLEEIDLSHNNIRTIDEQTFTTRKTTRNHVHKLILNNNEWNPLPDVDIFANFLALRKLHLSNAFARHVKFNLIAQMITTSANSLASLETLDLSDNSIEQIESDNFLCNLKSLQILDLSKNKLTRITLSERCTVHLTYLDLSNNQFVILDEMSMTFLSSHINTRIDLSRNPFHCDCHLIETVKWWQNASREINVLPDVTCSSPDPWAGKYLDSIETDQLMCHVAPTVATIIIILILVILICIFVALLFVKRQSVSRCFYTTTQPLRTKFEYSTISEKHENLQVDV